MSLRHGPGSVRDPSIDAENWGGRKAREYVQLTLETYGTVCWLCGLPGSDSADHVIPRSKGGAVYDLRNLGPSHRKCNYARGNRDAAGPAALVENGMAWFGTVTPPPSTSERLVVLLCGPPGAGKTTAARESGLQVFDRDDEQWITDRHFGVALDRLHDDTTARAVVIRHGASSSARAKAARQIGATHTYLVTAPRDELVRRIKARGRSDIRGTIAGVEHWHRDHDTNDDVLPFPGWASVMVH